MKYRYKKLNMVDTDNEQIYLENILNITNYSGQNIKVKDKKIIFISKVKGISDFSMSSDIYDALLESYNHFFNTYKNDTIDKNILNDIKKSLSGVKRLSNYNFIFRPIVDYIEIEMINFLSTNRKRKIRTVIKNSTYRKDSAYSSESSTESDTMDGDFCVLDIDDKNTKGNLHKRRMIKDDKNNSKDSKENKNCDSVVIDIKREIPNEVEFEDYNISEKIQKFLTAATNEFCNFCDKHTSGDNDTDCENKKQSIGYKLKNISNSIKKALNSLSFSNCFSGMSCICCSEIEEDEKNINDKNVR